MIEELQETTAAPPPWFCRMNGPINHSLVELDLNNEKGMLSVIPEKIGPRLETPIGGIIDVARSQPAHEIRRAGRVNVTTNGSKLANFAEQLANCGVERIDVSLDTLDPEKFRRAIISSSIGKQEEKP